MNEYTAEFNDQAVRFVLEEIEQDESRKHACDRLAPKLSVKVVTLYNWVKQSAPAKARPAASSGSIEELRAQNAALRKETRELAQANAILSDAAAFSGWRSTAKEVPASWLHTVITGRADVQSVAGRPSAGCPGRCRALSVGVPGPQGCGDVEDLRGWVRLVPQGTRIGVKRRMGRSGLANFTAGTGRSE